MGTIAPAHRVTGACLCGAVSWTTDAQLRGVFECHCPRCQRITGNFMAATAAPTTALVISGDEVRWYSPADDPNVAYGFCGICGSSLFFRGGVTDGSNTVTSICAGSIDGPSGLVTEAVWFAANAADHVRLDSRAAELPG
jgi:hypothetical protein